MLSMTTISGSPGEPDELENCIERIAGGDRAALGRLYELTGAAVYGFALSILKSRHDAEDVQQDVYLQIWTPRLDFRNYEKSRPDAYEGTEAHCADGTGGLAGYVGGRSGCGP